MQIYKLNNNNLTHISERIPIPGYQRSTVKTGIVHVGVGAFHRAHQAFYTDQLLNSGSTDWGICGVSLMDFDTRIFQTLQAQDGLYTLVVKELDGTWTPRVIGAIVEYLFAPENPQAVIDKMADPDVKIITLTITEGGYNYNEATGEFDFDNPLIKEDIAKPLQPKTIFGYLTQALKKRKDLQLKGLTLQSCDNIQGNGKMLKKMLLSFIKIAAPDLEAWVQKNVSFPNSMVDRITPVTLSQDIENLKKNSGIDDAWPVFCEPFIQWVIEDDFIEGRPEWENVGAQFVKEVEVYERMKLSLLNAGHSVLGILGALVGISTIDEAVRHPSLRAFLKRFLDQEVTPVLGAVEGIDLEEYKVSLIQRFENKNIKDQVDRICSESSAKIPVFVLPTINAQLKQDGPIDHCAFLIACWAIYCLGKNEQGRALNIKDTSKVVLSKQAQKAIFSPEKFLQLKTIFGDLGFSNKFTTAYKKAYRNISDYGVEKAISLMF